MRLWYTMGEQALTFYPVKFALAGVQRKEEILCKRYLKATKKIATKEKL